VDEPSWCVQWKVRHVVGHLIGGSDLRAREFLIRLLRSGLSFNRCMAREGLSIGTLDPAALQTKFRSTIGARRSPFGGPPVVMLVDQVCHGLDIRRPTGLTRAVPDDTRRVVADTLSSVGFPLGAKKRIAGLRLAATDAEWSMGDGPSVEGPWLSLISAMARRRPPLDDLTGEGVATLRARP
jgi:uncharacterized protein (TIGR03083 family)